MASAGPVSFALMVLAPPPYLRTKLTNNVIERALCFHPAGDCRDGNAGLAISIGVVRIVFTNSMPAR